MKKITLHSLRVFCTMMMVHSLQAQIGIGTTTPNASSALDVTSTNSGVLIPRIALLSNTDVTTIPAPAASLLVYNTGFSPNGYYYWNGTTWVQLATSGASNDWSLVGNTGTTAGTNYLGTTDAVDIRLKTGAIDRWNISHANSGQLQSYSLGSATSPTFSFQSDQNTGIFSSGTDALDITTGGFARLRFPNVNQVHALSAGTAALPFYSFGGDPNTGIFSSGADALDFATNGTAKFRIPAADQVHALSLGTAVLPFYTFSADSNTGMYSPGADILSISTAGAERMRIEADGDVGIGATPNASAKLEINATNRGLLIPNVALTAKNAAGPIAAPATSLLVYNTATAGISPNNVVPGFYYWNGTAWVAFTGANSNDWSITGNTGTGAANYVGTSDAVALKLSTNAAERIRVLANGQVVINNTGAPVAADRFSVYNTATADFAINGYSTLTGTGVFGQNTGTGSGIFGANSNSGQAVRGANSGSGIGVLGTAVNAAGAGVFGQANVGLGVGVYGTSNGADATGVFGNASGNAGTGVYGQSSGVNGTGVFGFANAAGGDGVYGEANQPGRYGVWGVNNNASGVGVYGSTIGGTGTGVWGNATGAAADGVFGLSTGATGFGVFGTNSNAAGTGVVGAGNNLTSQYSVSGSGGAFTGTGFGTVSYGTTTSNGVGIAAAGNNAAITSFDANGAGGAFTGNRWGTTSIATITGAGNDAIDRAVLAGTYTSAGTTSSTVYVGARIANVNYKILGTGGGSVSTTMKTSQGEKILFAPEAPENWFFDIGEVELVNGIATVQLDPTFVETISDSKPFKVFVQGGENTLGSIRITRNQKEKSFTVEDLGGPSNGTVQYNVYAIWKGKENLRFPEFKEENRPKPIPLQSITKESTSEPSGQLAVDSKSNTATQGSPQSNGPKATTIQASKTNNRTAKQDPVTADIPAEKLK